jgi:hypothetical protein
MVTAGVPGLPGDSVALLEERFDFVLLKELREALRRSTVALVVVDEAHHAAAASYQPIFETAPALRGLFLTATPIRTDRRPLGIDDIAYSTTYRQLFKAGVLVEPSFEEPWPSPNWELDDDLDELAQRILTRAENDFIKTLVVTTTVEKSLRLHAALERGLHARSHHILSLDDVGWIHASGNSQGTNAEAFLDEFQARPRGVLIATAGLLGEGFNDPSINAVVVSYPTQSLVQLMQVAGRCLRHHDGKTNAFVIQVRDSELSYHFEQRWLYQDISDLLRPQLRDIEYSDVADLRLHVERELALHQVSPELRDDVLESLRDVAPGDPCSLLFTGLPYEGSVERFSADASYRPFLVTSINQDMFLTVFNEFCMRETRPVHLDAFLQQYVQPDDSPGSSFRRYTEMLLAMQYARRELQQEQYHFAAHRDYKPQLGTTWLRYVTFRHVPTVPDALRDFLAPCHNRDSLLARYAGARNDWAIAMRLEIPQGGFIGYLLGDAASVEVARSRADLAAQLREHEPGAAFGVLAAWRASLEGSCLPLSILDRIERFVSDADFTQRALTLRSGAIAAATAPDSVTSAVIA